MFLLSDGLHCFQSGKFPNRYLSTKGSFDGSDGGHKPDSTFADGPDSTQKNVGAEWPIEGLSTIQMCHFNVRALARLAQYFEYIV